MYSHVLAAGARPCVWMSAGVIRYRLCTRNLECDTCPLDAALRGAFRAVTNGSPGLDGEPPGGHLPPDRLYSTGHLWMKALAVEPGVWRVGIDGFAAALLGHIEGVREESCGRVVARREPFCHMDLDVGTLTLGSPAGGRVVRANGKLHRHPELVTEDPFEAGWIVELTAADVAELEDLVPPGAAREQAELDLTRLRRSMAFRLLTDPPCGGSTGDGRGRLSEPRLLLGAAGYLDLLREFVH